MVGHIIYELYKGGKCSACQPLQEPYAYTKLLETLASTNTRANDTAHC